MVTYLYLLRNPSTLIFVVAAQQYQAIAKILLLLHDPSPQGGHLPRRSFKLAEELALQICGLACTNEDLSARVNAFGPMALCKTSSLSVGIPHGTF